MKKWPGQLEIALAAISVVWVVLLLIPGGAGLDALVQILLMLLALVVFARHWRRIVPNLLWRLRNRLIVAYLLIALVPVVLLTVIFGLSAYVFLGQFSVHLLSTELDRHTTLLGNVAARMASMPSAAGTQPAIPPNLSALFPGLEVAAATSGEVRRWPEESNLTPPPAGWNAARGLVVRDGVLYGWAHGVGEGRTVTAMFPLTRDFLGDLYPNLGESVIVDLLGGGRPLHPRIQRRSGTQNRIPPAVNAFDKEVDWFMPVIVSIWEKPGEEFEAVLIVRTRVSAVMRTLFSSNVQSNRPVPYLIGLALLFLIAEIISFRVGVNLTATITGAVHNLYEGTRRIRAGDFSRRIPIEGKDQLAELAASFNDMTGNIERLLQVEKDRQKIQTDLEIAREVQDQLYPRSVPETEDLSITAARSPARLVSGDYYDFQKLANGDVAIAVGDVAGKGISAALLMATIQSSFRMELRGALEMEASVSGTPVLRNLVSPSNVVSNLNKHLYEFTSPEKYATFFCSVYEKATSTLVYTNAGHLPPVLVRNGSCTRLEVNGMVVGAFPFANYDESRVELGPGDLLVLFTDGITEPENEYGEMFGEDRLSELVTRNAGADDQALVDEILAAVREWTGSDELQDDMTLLLVRRRAT